MRRFVGAARPARKTAWGLGVDRQPPLPFSPLSPSHPLTLSPPAAPPHWPRPPVPPQVKMVTDCIGDVVSSAVAEAKNGDVSVLLLPINLRLTPHTPLALLSPNLLGERALENPPPRLPSREAIRGRTCSTPPDNPPALRARPMARARGAGRGRELPRGREREGAHAPPPPLVTALARHSPARRGTPHTTPPRHN